VHFTTGSDANRCNRALAIGNRASEGGREGAKRATPLLRADFSAENNTTHIHFVPPLMIRTHNRT
jgi:hypothetical protein